jgi:hypothetical protein
LKLKKNNKERIIMENEKCGCNSEKIYEKPLKKIKKDIGCGCEIETEEPPVEKPNENENCGCGSADKKTDKSE